MKVIRCSSVYRIYGTISALRSSFSLQLGTTTIRERRTTRHINKLTVLLY
jgi:hypothetical protein